MQGTQESFHLSELHGMARKGVVQHIFINNRRYKHHRSKLYSKV